MRTIINSIQQLTLVLALSMTSMPVFSAEAGEVVGRHIFGLARDYQGDPLIIDNDPLIYTKGISSKKITVEDTVFEISLFDNDIGSIYVTKVDNDTGEYLDTRSLDVSMIEGISRPVGSVKTSWNSLLFSENQLADASEVRQFSNIFSPYYKNNASMVNPYNYGWINELVVFDKSGNAKVIKNYSMGRISASKIVAMPDNRTFYLLDSNYSGNLYVFVSDKEKTMTSGVLYIMYDRGNGDTAYLDIGSASALKMKFRLKDAGFDKIFDYVESTEGKCPVGYGYIKTVYGDECLSIKSKYKKYAGKFEPIRTAALSGVGKYAEDITNVSLDHKSNKLVLTTNSGNNLRLELTHNESMNSDYIAEASK